MGTDYISLVGSERVAMDQIEFSNEKSCIDALEIIDKVGFIKHDSNRSQFPGYSVICVKR